MTALALVLLARNAAAWVETALEKAALALAPGDEAVLADLGSQDETPALLARAAGRAFPAGIRVTHLKAGDADRTLEAALAATSAPYLLRLGGHDIPRAAGIAALRPLLAAGPPAVIAPAERWWIEPGVVLAPGPLPDAAGLVLRRDLAADPARRWRDDPAALWGLLARLRADGATSLAQPLVRVPLPQGPVPLPAAAPPALAAALAAEALIRPDPGPAGPLLADLRRLLAGAPHGPLPPPLTQGLLSALAGPDDRALAALAEARLGAAEARAAALAVRVLALRAARDAERPDADNLIRAHARLVAEVAARRDPP